MCNDIPRNQLHEKMFGELIAEELHRTLSHISCTPASVACFGELVGCKSELKCCATWVPKMHMANLGIFFGCVGSRSTKTLENMSLLGCTCVKMEPFVLLTFFCPGFIIFFTSKLDIFPQIELCLECRKGHDGGQKGQMVSLGRTHKQPKCLQNKGKPTRPQSASSQGLASKWTKHNFLTGEKAPKGQMVPFSRSHNWVPDSKTMLEM